MKREDAIGKKACGVVVSPRFIYYTTALGNYVGKTGVIVDKDSDSFTIKFDDGKECYYPIKRLEEAIKLAETSSSEPTTVSNPDSSFPEKWCLKVNEDNVRMLSDWRSAGKISNGLGGYVMYEGYSFKGVRGFYEPVKPKSCTEITTKQFREHVLKETSEVVVEPTEFKKGNYIVLLEDTLSNFFKNYCVKQSKNCSHLHAELTCCGNKNDGSSNTKFDQSGFKWRYATPEEAAKYNSIGKPYDVTTLVTKPAVEEWSVGTYCVAMHNGLNWSQTARGDIYFIKDKSYADNINRLPAGKNLLFQAPKKPEKFKWFATKEEAEEFAKTLTKEVVEEEFKVGDWVVWCKESSDFKGNSVWNIGAKGKIASINPHGLGFTEWYDCKGAFSNSSGSCYKECFRKALPHEIPTSTIGETKVMTEKQLIEEAKRKYPIGTIFSNSNLGLDCHGIKVTGEGFYKDKWGDIVIDNLSNALFGRYTVYKDGEWAKVTTPVRSLSQLIATKHWGPELVGKSFISEVDDLNGSRCKKEIPYTIVKVEDNQLAFKLNEHSTYYISKSNFLKHCKLVPDSTAKVADDPKNVTIPEIQQTKSTVNYTVSTALTELTVNIPNGRKTKQVPVITIELSHINCNL
jgi:hypothetical protein